MGKPRSARSTGDTTRVRRSVLGALAGVAALLATGVTAAPASAAPDPGVMTPSARERALAFWTPQRMREATPLDLLTVDRSDVRTPAPRTGRATVVAPSAPTSATGPLAFPHGGGPWSGGGAVTKTAGRVFFSYQGRTASCSGNAVTSANKSTVITAGLCV